MGTVWLRDMFLISTRSMMFADSQPGAGKESGRSDGTHVRSRTYQETRLPGSLWPPNRGTIGVLAFHGGQVLENQ